MLTNQLLYYVKLCEVGNITKAAEELYLSRQALSNSIKKMEEEVGAVLLIRKKNGVELTDAGRLVLEFAQTALSMWDATLRTIKPDKFSSELTFGTDLNYLPSVVMRSIRPYEHENRTKVQIHHYEDHREIWDAVTSGEIDIGLTTYVRPENPAISQQLVISAPIYCLLGIDNALANLPRINYSEDLKKQQVFCGSDLHRRLKSYAKQTGVSPIILKESLQLAKEKLIRSNSVILIPEHSVQSLLSEDLLAKEVVSFPLNINGYIIFRNSNRKKIENFFDFLSPILHTI